MINIVTLEGRLAAIPNLTKTGNGRSCANFVIAHKREGYGHGVDYIRCVAWGRVADALVKHKTKGDPLIIQGFLREEVYENWQKQDVRQVVGTAMLIHYLPREPDARWVDRWLDAYPELKKQYNTFVREELKTKDELKENENEPDSISNG